MIEVLHSGALNSVQDLGRKSARRWGIGRAGAMDPLALRLGNLLLGNEPGEAGVEVAIFPFRLRFQEECGFAVTGAAAATLDGQRLPPCWAAKARAGQILALAPCQSGVFAYVCFSGGLDTPIILGARATDLKSGFGGVGGKALQAGQTLALLRPSGRLTTSANGIGLAPGAIPENAGGEEVVLRFIAAAEWEDFAGAPADTFQTSAWRVGREVNRQGYRLSGPELRPARARELLSHGIVPGVIQVPPQGQPLVQMVEANTAGGYPKLGVVIDTDLRLLAQRRSGQSVRFRKVGWEEAMAAQGEAERRLSRLASSLRIMRETSDDSRRS